MPDRLTILSDTLVTRVLLDGRRAIGVECLPQAHAYFADPAHGKQATPWNAIRPLLREIRGLSGYDASPVRPAVTRESQTLTPREHEVLTLVATGRSNRDIGQQLFISAKTVSVHISNVLAKLEATSRTEAVADARRRGLLG